MDDHVLMEVLNCCNHLTYKELYFLGLDSAMLVHHNKLIKGAATQILHENLALHVLRPAIVDLLEIHVFHDVRVLQLLGHRELMKHLILYLLCHLFVFHDFWRLFDNDLFFDAFHLAQVYIALSANTQRLRAVFNNLEALDHRLPERAFNFDLQIIQTIAFG